MSDSLTEAPPARFFMCWIERDGTRRRSANTVSRDNAESWARAMASAIPGAQHLAVSETEIEAWSNGHG